MMVVVYRGLHCQICKSYMKELDGKRKEFAKRGVHVIAVSTDSRDRAEQAQREWSVTELKVGFGLTIASAGERGLNISRFVTAKNYPARGEA